MRMHIRGDPFPAFKYCKLTYSQRFTLTAGTAGIIGTEQVFRLNSLYDPDFTGTGHQPYLFDQVAALYRKYIVSGCKIRATFTDPGVSGTTGTYCYAMLQASGGSDTLTGSDQDYIREQPLTWSKFISDTGNQKAVLNQYVSMPKLEGLTRIQWGAEVATYGASVGANPSRTPYLRVAIGSDTGAANASCTVRVDLQYYCKFYDRESAPQS